MWKFLSRGIRETLERRVNCRTNVYSQTKQDGNTRGEVKSSLTCTKRFVAPSFSAYTNGFCGSAKSSGAEDKNRESKWNAKHTWSEAVGWSSVLAIGWVMCQSLCLRKRIFERDRNELLNVSELSKARVSYFLNQILNLHHKNVLPVVNCIDNGNNKYDQGDRDVEWHSEKPFGPITVEEALKEAEDDFTDTHNQVMGEFEFRYGLKALEEQRYKDAVEHFSAGAEFLSPGSMFNLGLCYELGIGTLVDQAMAAKYYSAAAEHNHMDALYNLGVFHAQGRGGLPMNIDIARTYFTKAAKLGQAQAQLALDLERASIPETNKITKSELFPGNSVHSVNHMQNNSNPSNIFIDSTIHKNHLRNTHINVKSTFEISQRHENIEESKSPTEIFLEFLGVNEPKPISVVVGPNNCRVPC